MSHNLCPYFKTKAFPRLQCISLWMAGIMFFRIVHMSDWHCESRADSGMENDRDGCLGLEIQCHLPVLWSYDDKSIKDRGSAMSEDLQKESCYTWRRNLEPVCLSDHCSPLLPHVKKVHFRISWTIHLKKKFLEFSVEMLLVWGDNDERTDNMRYSFNPMRTSHGQFRRFVRK